MKTLKPIRFYLPFLVALLGYYAYATYLGIGYYDSKPERNSGAVNRSRGVHINRFYHK